MAPRHSRRWPTCARGSGGARAREAGAPDPRCPSLRHRDAHAVFLLRRPQWTRRSRRAGVRSHVVSSRVGDPSGSRAVRAWAIGGTACFLAAHAAFWILIQPASEVLGGWTPDAVSSNWTRFRDQWEWIHTIRAGLMLIGFCALLRSVFLDLPSRRARRDLPGKDYSFLELACSTAPESRDA